jgi:5-amino-6-(5-phosphoribosylamino)uracil reductase
MTPFDEFVARKERQALTARLEPWTTELDVHDAAMRAIGNAWTRASFDGNFFVSPSTSDDLLSTSLVFVQSRDGNTVAKDPSALGGGETDKHLIYEGLSRVAADAVMAGAETIRGGRIAFSVWHPELVTLRQSLGLPRHPIQVVATLQGFDLSDGLLFNTPELGVAIVTVASCDRVFRDAVTARPWMTMITMEHQDDLAHAFSELRRMGVRTMSCVGGRTLAGQLIDHGLVRDLYLTTSAKEGGQPNTPLYSKPLETALALRKRGTGTDAGIRFEHHRLRI